MSVKELASMMRRSEKTIFRMAASHQVLDMLKGEPGVLTLNAPNLFGEKRPATCHCRAQFGSAF
jgi:hypothetical protein